MLASMDVDQYRSPRKKLLRFVLEAATSLRAAGRVLEVLEGWLPGVERAPAANTGQWWLLRLGLYELQRPKEMASDWIWLVDHTIQLGQVKCLLIVAVRLSAAESNRPDAKLGWLREYREALEQWGGMLAVVDETLKAIRQDGYCRDAASVLRDRLSCLPQDAMSHRMADRVVAFVTEQSAAVVGEEHLPGSTECLESLMGKGKRLEGQQSRSGFTKMVLGMAASVAEPTVEYIRTALDQVKTHNVTAWCKEKLGVSVQAQRRQALPPLLDGIKTG